MATAKQTTTKGLRLVSTDGGATTFHVAGLLVGAEPVEVKLSDLTQADLDWIAEQPRLSATPIDMTADEPAPATN